MFENSKVAPTSGSRVAGNTCISPFFNEVVTASRFVKGFGIAALIYSLVSITGLNLLVGGIGLGIGMFITGYDKAAFYRVLGLAVSVFAVAQASVLKPVLLSGVLAAAVMAKGIQVLAVLAKEGRCDEEWKPTLHRTIWGTIASGIGLVISGVLIFLFFAQIKLPDWIRLGARNPEAPGVWVTQDTETGDSFYSANFVNESVGWLNGQSGRSYEPPEGNENANKNAKPKKPGAKVEDPLKANQGFEVLQTADGGQTWGPIPDQFKNKIRSVWFADPQQGWALTIDRNILHSTDGGASWTLQRKAGTVKLKLPGNRREPELQQPEQIDQVRFIDASHGWAWGGGRKDEFAEQPGILLTTIDGGQNWNEIPYPFDQTASAVFFLDAEHAWASTTGGSFYKTGDGGLNWTKVQTKLPEDVFRSIFFTSPNDGWVVGRSGRIAKTSDGARTWRKMYEIKDEFKMHDIFFTDRNHGWAIGDEGAILYTPDAGESWVDVGAPIPARLMNVVFVNNRVGWAVGLSGAVLKYEPK